MYILTLQRHLPVQKSAYKCWLCWFECHDGFISPLISQICWTHHKLVDCVLIWTAIFCSDSINTSEFQPTSWIPLSTQTTIPDIVNKTYLLRHCGCSNLGLRFGVCSLRLPTSHRRTELWRLVRERVANHRPKTRYPIPTSKPLYPLVDPKAPH